MRPYPITGYISACECVAYKRWVAYTGYGHTFAFQVPFNINVCAFMGALIINLLNCVVTVTRTCVYMRVDMICPCNTLTGRLPNTIKHYQRDA